MSFMFQGCSSLIYINLSNFYTSLVKFIGYMFYKFSTLITLDLTSFNTSSVKGMHDMFKIVLI